MTEENTGIITEQLPQSEFTQQEPFKIHYSKTGLVQDCKCLLCNPPTFHVEGSVASHEMNKHGQGRKYGVNYVRVDENGIELPSHTRKNKTNEKTNNIKTKSAIKQQIQSQIPKGMTLRIPMIIEIPVVFGEIKFSE